MRITVKDWIDEALYNYIWYDVETIISIIFKNGDSISCTISTYVDQFNELYDCKVVEAVGYSDITELYI